MPTIRQSPPLPPAPHSVYPPDSAGSQMSSDVPIARQEDTLETVTQELFSRAKDFASVSYIYIIDRDNKLTGVFSINEIFTKDKNTKVKDIMIKDIVKAHPTLDQEKVAHKALRHNIKAIPVVDKQNSLLGVVTSDQILKILDKESREDLLKLSGIIGRDNFTEEMDLTVEKSYLRRIPWIFAGLIGGIFTAHVIGNFEGILQKHIILASFVPLIAYIANAVGTQTQTLYIRDLARNPTFTFRRYAARQLLIAILIGLSCWAFLLTYSMFSFNSLILGNTIGFSVFTAIIVATFFSLFIPTMLSKLKQDPAVGSGPFTTIIQDLLSIIIYFSIASLLL
jgi:magnesium transporter